MVENDPDGHVNYMTFGVDKADDRRWFHELAANTKKVDSYTAELLLRERYETHYGIFNHDDPAAPKLRPLALVALHPKEDSFRYSMRHRLYWRFRDYDMGKHYNLSFKEFLELPWETTQALFAIEQRRAQQVLREEEARRRQEEKGYEALQRDYSAHVAQNYKSPKRS